jgi:hypothetical protein
MVSREYMLRQIAEICPEVWPHVSACYGDVRFSFVGAHLARASTGGDRGEALGPLLFAVAVAPLLLSIRDRFQGLLQGWYLNDGNLIGGG